jgi:hypothetical protein
MRHTFQVVALVGLYDDYKEKVIGEADSEQAAKDLIPKLMGNYEHYIGKVILFVRESWINYGGK